MGTQGPLALFQLLCPVGEGTEGWGWGVRGKRRWVGWMGLFAGTRGGVSFLEQLQDEVPANIIAAEIEEAVFTSSGHTVNDNYKQKFRRLEFNIKVLVGS